MKSCKSWSVLGAILMIGIFSLLPVDTAHAQESFHLAMTIESVTLTPQTGEVVVSGTVTCSEPATGFLNVGVRQPIGRLKSIDGFSSIDVQCDEDGEPYTLSIFAFPGIFKPGNGVIEEFFFACTLLDPNVCSNARILPQTVRLRQQK